MNDGMKLCVVLFTSFFLLSLTYFPFPFFFFFSTCFYYGTGLGLFRDIPYIHNFFCIRID